MSKIKVIDIISKGSQFEVGCTNGNYEDTELVLNNGKVLHVEVCRCGNGCNGTARICGGYNQKQKRHTYITDYEFKNMKALYSFLYD